MMKNLFLVLTLSILFGCGGEPQTLAELKKAGEAAMAKNEFTAARGFFQKALEQQQSDKQLLYFIGLCFQKDNQHDSALVYLKRADLLYPEDREINITLYYSAREQSEFRYGIDAINVLIDTGDPEEKWLSELAMLHIAVDNYIRAYVIYEKMMARDDSSPELYIQMANCAAMIDSTHISLRLMDTAIAKFGEQESFMMNRATYLAALKQFDEAESILRGYLDKSSNLYGLKLNLANILSRSPSKAKRREGLKIYESIITEFGSVPFLDSTVGALREELK